MTTRQTTTDAVDNGPGQAASSDGEDLTRALARAHRGDATGIELVRKFLDEHPKARRMMGNLVNHVQARLIRDLCGDDLVIEEAIKCQLHEMRSSLGGSNPTRSESLLIDRILTTWLTVNLLDMKVLDLPSKNLRAGDQVIKLQHQASVQHNKALRELAIMRRLLPDGGVAPTETVLDVPSTAALPIDGPTLAVVDAPPEDHGSESVSTPHPAAPAPPAPPAHAPDRADRPSCRAPNPPEASPTKPAVMQEDDDAPVFGIHLKAGMPRWMSECALEEA